MSRREEVLNYFDENKDYMNDRIKTGIEQNRKGYANLEFVDKDGNPVRDVKVNVKQINHEFKYGANLFMLDELETEEKNEKFKQYFKDAFNLATLPFYWKDLEPKEGFPRYSKESEKIYRRPAPDLCLEFCKKNKIEPKMHCLNYMPWSPDWLEDDIVNTKKKLEKRFCNLAEHYADRIPNWEVINETLCNCSRKIFQDPEIVSWSFEHSRKYFPVNELTINEATRLIWYNFKYNRSQYYMQIERELYNHTSIDSIGFQFHVFENSENEASVSKYLYNPVNIYNVLDQYAKLGKPMQITETTIPCYTDSEEDEAIQAELIKNLYSIWFSHEAMEKIIYWNLPDGYAAWAPQGDMAAGENYFRGGLLRFDLTPKPAYYVIKNMFEKEWRTNESIAAIDNGQAKFKGFYGEYELEIYSGEKNYTRKIKLSKQSANDFKIVL